MLLTLNNIPAAPSAGLGEVSVANLSGNQSPRDPITRVYVNGLPLFPDVVAYDINSIIGPRWVLPAHPDVIHVCLVPIHPAGAPFLERGKHIKMSKFYHKDFLEVSHGYF